MLFSPVYAKPQHRLPASPQPASPLRNLCSYRYRSMGSEGLPTYRRSNVNPLECVVTDKHRVLPVFDRNRPRSSSLDATLMRMLINVHSKGLKVAVNPFRCNTYRKYGGRVLANASAPRLSASCVTPAPLQRTAFGATICKGTGFLHHPGKQRRSPRCLRLRERTSGTAGVWSPLQVVPGPSVLTPNGVLTRVSGFVLTTPTLPPFTIA